MTRAAEQRDERADAIAKLREWLKPGDTVYTILRHVSRSGMLRTIDALIFIDGKPRYLSYNIAALGLYREDRKREGLRVEGCGMDMGFEVVYNLGRVLWPEGVPCSGENCHSNDHTNGLREECQSCKGSGKWVRSNAGDDCPVCKGRGQTWKPYPRGAGVMHRDDALQARWL